MLIPHQSHDLGAIFFDVKLRAQYWNNQRDSLLLKAKRKRVRDQSAHFERTQEVHQASTGQESSPRGSRRMSPGRGQLCRTVLIGLDLETLPPHTVRTHFSLTR